MTKNRKSQNKASIYSKSILLGCFWNLQILTQGIKNLGNKFIAPTWLQKS